MNVSYHTKSHTFNNMLALVLLLMTFGMSGMYATIMIGAPVWVSMIALLVPMVALLAFTSGKAVYTINDEELQRSITPFAAKYLSFIPTKRAAYRWSKIKHFKNGKEVNRSMQEYEYLEIYFTGGKVWQITDQENQAEFTVFKNAFLQKVEELNSSAVGSPAKDNAKTPTANTAATTVRSQKIEQRKTFYETVWAKITFWIFALLYSAIIGFLFLNPEYNKWQYQFRLGIIAIPGLAYMWYRIYGTGRKK